VGWGLVVLGLLAVVLALDLVTGEGGSRTFITRYGERHGDTSERHYPAVLDGAAKWVLGGFGGALGGVMVWGGSRLLRSRQGRRSDGY
jgi:hypothetical protein